MKIGNLIDTMRKEPISNSSAIMTEQKTQHWMIKNSSPSSDLGHSEMDINLIGF